ncbi:hypothetical protein N665_0445s0068 [Sinapis alba]|nr:hypothetical protein N665_0445s0068 [Sinapis alba]
MCDSATRFVHEVRVVQTDGQVFDYYLVFFSQIRRVSSSEGILNLMAKKVLMTSNGTKVSRNIAIQLAKHGCRLVLLGNEASLRTIVDYIRVSIEVAFPVDLIGLDMKADSQDTFLAAVQKAWICLGSFDAFLN